MKSGFRRLLDALHPYHARTTPKGWSYRCPAHKDQRPSLEVKEGDNGSPLVKCWAGCPSDAILSAVGLTWADALREDDTVSHHRAVRQPVATAQRTEYLVCNRAGDVVAIHVRTDKPDGSKGFTWRRPGGLSGLGGSPVISLPLFGVELLDGQDGPVYLCEGEKKALSLRTLGVLALGTVTGAAGTPSPEVLAVLKDRDVILWPDHDDVGRSHMRRIGEALGGVAKSVRPIAWGQDAGDDAADFVARGGTREELEQIVANAADPTNCPRCGHDTCAGTCSGGPALPLAPAKPATETSDGGQYGSLLCLADVTSEPVEWLWRGRLAFGKLALLDGDPGLGKSTITLSIAAACTTGRAMPFSDERHEPLTVVFASAEDGAADTIRPRFEAAGGDPQRFHLLLGRADSTGFRATLSLDDVGYIEAAVREVNARVLVLDPLSAFLSEKTDSFKDASVRRSLAPIVAMAERQGIAVVVVRHLTKGGGPNPVYRGQGSIGIIGAARLGLIVGQHPDDPTRCVLAVSKSNIGAKPSSLVYRIEGVQVGEGIETSRIAWEALTDHSAADLVASPIEPEAGKERYAAADFLRERLAGGAKPVKEIEKDAKDAGIHLRTLRRAKGQLGVRAKKTGMKEGWTWELPAATAEGGQGAPKVSTVGLATFGEVGHLQDSIPVRTGHDG